MRIEVIQAHELDQGLIETWRDLQAGNPHLRSPYYCPDYAQLVHASLRAAPPSEDGFARHVEVAVIESDDAKVQGFLAFQRGTWGRISPVGRFLTDYQGMVCADDFSACDAQQLLAGIGARYFAFNHLPLTAAVFSPKVKILHKSPVLDLEGGYGAYVERLKIAQGTPKPGLFAHVSKRVKRLVRDLGPLRFETHEHSGARMDRLIELKIAQWKIGNETSQTVFELPWVSNLMNRLFDTAADASGSGFRAVLSTLYAGETLVAMQFGLRHDKTMHCWFPVYEPALATYSAGTILMNSMTEGFAAEGISLIDMGRGEADYKARICTGHVPLGEGAVSRPALAASAYLGGKLVWRAARARFTPLSRLHQGLQGLRQALKK